MDYHTHQNRLDKSKLKNFHNETDEWLVGVEVEKVDRDLQQEGDAWEILSDGTERGGAPHAPVDPP